MPLDGKITTKPDAVREVLEKALALIEDRRHWCSGSERHVVSTGDGGEFVQYCAVGAIRAAADYGGWRTVHSAMDALAKKLPMPPSQPTLWADMQARDRIITWNDKLAIAKGDDGHSVIVAAFKRAIEER